MPVIRPFLRRVLFVVVALVLLALSWSGVTGGMNQWGQSRSPGQIVQTLSQFTFGLFALMNLVTMIGFRRWSRVAGAGLVVSLALAGGLGAVAWGRTSVAIGIIAALASAAIGLGIAWLARVAVTLPKKPSRGAE